MHALPLDKISPLSASHIQQARVALGINKKECINLIPYLQGTYKMCLITHFEIDKRQFKDKKYQHFIKYNGIESLLSKTIIVFLRQHLYIENFTFCLT